VTAVTVQAADKHWSTHNTLFTSWECDSDWLCGGKMAANRGW